MKKEVSDKQLIITILIAISISLLSILISVTRLNITGASSSDTGYVNITVLSAVDLTIRVNAINFSATNPGKTRNSYNASDTQDCTADSHCGFEMINSGTKFINITIYESENLFDSSNYDNKSHYSYNTTIQDIDYDTAYGANGNCSTGYDQGLKGPDDTGATGQWRAIPRDSDDAEVALCYLNYTDTPPDGNDEHRPDTARVEINITVPADEPAGDKEGTLTFTATAAN